MKKLSIVALLCGGVCAAQTPPSPEAFKPALQTILSKEKPACVALFNPADPTGHLTLKSGYTAQLTPRENAYYTHGLIVRSDASVPFTDPSRIPISKLFLKKNNAWRYDWAPAVSGDVVNDQLCYGYHPTVDEVKRWTDPTQGETTVQYTWHYEKVADWAKQQAWLETADPDVWKAAAEPSQTSQQTLKLFNDGWH